VLALEPNNVLALHHKMDVLLENKCYEEVIACSNNTLDLNDAILWNSKV